MNIFILCNADTLVFPVIKKLLIDNQLAGIGIIKRLDNHLHRNLSEIAPTTSITVLQKSTWVDSMHSVLTQLKADVVWVLTFPWKIPIQLLEVPRYGFINFHFGLLPKYKGADPVFWQIKNGEPLGGLTIHKMNEYIDEGPVILQEQLPIAPGENYGFHCLKLGQLAANSTDRIVEFLISGSGEYLIYDKSVAAREDKPNINDLTIHWNDQAALEIENLINAANPKYGGANTMMQNTDMRILEVTPVNMDYSQDFRPGQIILADATYGVIVGCVDKEFLRITVAQTAEGYMSGVKLFNLGFTRGFTFS